MFMGKTRNSHSTSPSQGALTGSGEYNTLGGGGGGTLHPIQGEVEILLVAACQRNWNKVRMCGPVV